MTRRALPLLFAFAGLLPAAEPWSPFDRIGYPTSSFAENRGSRYHAGVDLGTEMEQGWPVKAPEDGWIVQVRVGPFFYGKNLLFEGVSGERYLFAHLCGFPGPVSKRVFAAMEKAELAKCDLQWSGDERIPAKKGEVVAFAGKTGIGNPHLHVERRDADGHALSPVEIGLIATDSIAPQILAVAALKEGVPLSVAVPGPDGVEIAIPARGATLAAKIVDYSRDPRENPMSATEVTLRCKGGKGTLLHSKRYERLTFGKMGHVFQDLLWAREGEEAGDWHALTPWPANPKESPKGSGDPNLCLEKGKDRGEAVLRAVDMSGHATELAIHLTRAKEPVRAAVAGGWAENQPGPVFTFLAQPFVLDGGDTSRPALPLSEANLPEGAAMRRVGRAGGDLRLESGTWTVEIPVAKGLWERTAAAVPGRDSTGEYLELHPKGLALRSGKRIRICAALPVDARSADRPEKGWGIFWRSESAREWNAFSALAPQGGKDGEGRFCATVDEMRDIALRRDTIPPVLDSLRVDTLWLDGRPEPALSIHVDERGGAGFGGAANFGARQDGKWVYSEYNMTDRRLRLPRARLLSPNGEIRVRVADDFGNAAERLLSPDDFTRQSPPSHIANSP